MIDTLSYPDLAGLDAARLAQLKELQAAVVSEYDPDVDLRRGTVQDLVIHPRALLAAQNEQAVVGALNAGSLAELALDASAAPAGAVDRVLGNYGLVRRAAAKASGTVAIVLDNRTPVVVPSGSVFTINGLAFAADRVYAARTSSLQVVGPGDRLLTPAGTDDWLFIVGVTAAEAGAAGNARRGSVATPLNAPVDFLRAYADADFSGGADAETNAQLLARQAAGLAVKAWSGRPGIESVIRARTVATTTTNSDGTVTTTTSPAYPTLLGISVVGAGDQEMLRDKHSLWPVAGGGRADLYARTDETYRTLRVRKTASLLSKSGSVGTWQAGLARDDAPGYYEVVKVLLTTQDAGAAGFATASEVRSLDLTGTGWKPDVSAALEGVYSYYQAGTYTFVDTVTDATALTIGAAADYDVVVRGMPQVKDLQLLWNDARYRPPMGDVLVKAPIPCFTSVAFTLNVRRGVAVDVAAVRKAVAGVVNGLGFPGSLAGSLLAQTLHTLLGAGLVNVSDMALSGRLRKPSGATVTLTSATQLVIADDFAEMVSGRTAAFLTEDALVSVTLATVDVPGV